MGPTTKQTLILWALLARPGATAPQKDLKREVNEADRDALKAQGLITVHDLKSGIWLEGTERGRAWASDPRNAGSTIDHKPALTKMQTRILEALIDKPGATAPQKGFKPAVKKADRDALKAAGLITERKMAGGFQLEMTERGWTWASDHLDADLPLGSETLQGWLSQLKIFLDAKGFVLADMFASAAPPVILSPASLPERIRAAYLDCTGGALNQRLFLTKLREKLPDVDHAALDDALRKMHGHDGMHLSNSEDPREATAADHAASLDYKGLRMSLIRITQ
jgi:hypothetical protein